MATPASTQSKLSIIAAGETDRGRKRRVNEDAILLRADVDLYMVADGAGGHNAGNVASALATTSVAKSFDASARAYANKPDVDAFGLWSAARRLSHAVQLANAAVIEIARSSNKYRGMGTTIVALQASPKSGRIHVAHVGDSRCYRLRKGHLDQLTTDHSMISDVVELRPDLDDAALAKLPSKAVTRALGLEDALRVAVRSCRLVAGDRYLLCTDGLTLELDDDEIEHILVARDRAEDAVRALVDAAKAAGGRDNIGVVVVDCRKGALRDSQRPPPLVQKPSSPSFAAVGAASKPSKPPSKPGKKPGRSFPPRPAKRKKKAKAPPDDPEIEITGEEMGLDPEILLVRGTDDDFDDDDVTNPRITAVPAVADDSKVIKALGTMADAITATKTRCAECEAEYERDALYCLHCGASQNAPLSRR